MKRQKTLTERLRILPVFLVTSFLPMASDLSANCRNEGPYPIRQCQAGAYFSPPPSGSGAISAAWWQLGFGNRSAVDPTMGVSTNPTDGDGFINTPLPGVFVGNDSGALSVGPVDGTPTGGMDLVDAGTIGGPPGSLCFGSGANWAIPFVDGCADNNIAFWFGGAYDVSDEFLNPYWYTYGGMQGTYSLYSQLDRPMGFLLTEATNKSFALAFIATKSRGGDASDATPGQYDLADLTNGDHNPLSGSSNAHNVIPWQPVPQPIISPSFSDPGDVNSDRVLAISRTPIRLVHDASYRPNPLASQILDEDPERQFFGAEAGGQSPVGVGVLDQPELARYQIQIQPLGNDGECDPSIPWTDSGPPLMHPESSTSKIVPPDTCVRLCTVFGRLPRSVLRTAQTSSNRAENRLDAQAAMLGDLGFEVCSRSSKIGGPLVVETQVILRAVLLKNRTLVVEFETLAEVGATGFDVIAVTYRGVASLISSVECNQCSTGIGSSYHLEIPLRPRKLPALIFIASKPSGIRSNQMSIRVENKQERNR